jgi:hypothetical protein
MPLIESLTAAGVRPRKQTISNFFAAHPEVLVEAEAAKAAGYTWQQIASAIEKEWGFRPCQTSLHDWVRQS